MLFAVWILRLVGTYFPLFDKDIWDKRSELSTMKIMEAVMIINSCAYIFMLYTNGFMITLRGPLNQHSETFELQTITLVH